jgi:hypothetical protein
MTPPLAIGLTSAAVLAAVVAFRLDRLPLTVSTKWSVHNTLIGRPVGERLLGAAEAVTHHLGHVVAPFDLMYDYGYAAIVPGPGLTRSWRIAGARLASYSVRVYPNAMAPRYLTAASAAWEGRDDDAAWGMLAACAIYRSFPAPVSMDTIPAEWERRPAPARIFALRKRIGEPAFATVRAAAMSEAQRRELDGVWNYLATLR